MALEGEPGRIYPIYDVAGDVIGRQAYQYVTMQGVGRCIVLVTTDEPHPPDPINIKVYVTPVEGPRNGTMRSIDYNEDLFPQLNADLHAAFDQNHFLTPQSAMQLVQDAHITANQLPVRGQAR